ncbi:MAG TPA: flagellar basal-body MS-ring/collar protein FliF [bacterium]|nr:flagellar basal-body MS-ring/collar protein FliF [bacterium]HOL48542.1 flagellar basal-body MS-ring/collar protein FliF [bacterium]HPQ19930.1 flagellar basal-body MS-ring/collar protein FliF [bacterium]
MKDLFQKYIEQFKKIWGNLNKNQKIIYSSIIGLVIIFFIVLLIFSTGTKYAPLFEHQINIEESGKISKQLNQWNIKYKYEGGLLLVPKAERNSILLKLASENKLPQVNYEGFKLFDNLKFGATEYEKHIQYLRALEGELANMIASLEPVKSAAVQIHIPKQRLYLEEEEPSKASITITLHPYAKISKKQIEGIMNLAVYSIPGLKRENVAIVSSEGITLSDFRLEEELEETKIGKQEKLKREKQNELENKIMYTIGKAYGFDKVRASVVVEMNFDRIESKEENYSQTGFEPIKQSSENIKEEFEGVGLKPGGNPGVDNNVPIYKGVKDFPIKYKKEETRDNFQPNKAIITKIKNPSIERITASVQIDGDYEEKTDKDGLPEWIYKPRTQEELDKIRNLVETAIGINPGRGDKVVVENIQFDRREEFTAKRNQIIIAKKREEILKYSILAVIIFILLTIIAVELNKRWILVREELNKKRALAAKESMDTGIIYEVEMSAADREKLEIQKRAQQAARDDPEMVANLLKTWLLEE